MTKRINGSSLRFVIILPKTIREDKSDENILNCSKEWFFTRITQKIDNIVTIESTAC